MRTTTNPGLFAENAVTVIPPSPVTGTTYRDDAAGLAEIHDGWPHNAKVDSKDDNKILHSITTLLALIDTTGILD